MRTHTHTHRHARKRSHVCMLKIHTHPVLERLGAKVDTFGVACHELQHREEGLLVELRRHRCEDAAFGFASVCGIEER